MDYEILTYLIFCPFLSVGPVGASRSINFLCLPTFLCIILGSDDEAEEDDRLSRHRRIHEPEVLSEGDEEQEDDDADAGDDDAQMDSDGGSTSGI